MYIEKARSSRTQHSLDVYSEDVRRAERRHAGALHRRDVGDQGGEGGEGLLPQVRREGLRGRKDGHCIGERQRYTRQSRLRICSYDVMLILAGLLVPQELLPLPRLHPPARLSDQQRRPGRRPLLQEVLQQEVGPADQGHLHRPQDARHHEHQEQRREEELPQVRERDKIAG